MGQQRLLHNSKATRQRTLRGIACGLMFLGVLAIDRAWAGPDYDIPVTPLYQNDYPDKIDSSNETIAHLGCTLTAWTMLFNYETAQMSLHQKNPDGTQGGLIAYTPADINRLLNDYRYVQTTYKKDASGKYIRGPDGKPVVDTQTTYNGWSLPIGPNGKPTGSTTDLNIGAMLKAVQQDTKTKSYEGKGLTQDRYISPGFAGIPKNEIPNGGLVLGPGYTRIVDLLKDGHPVVVRVANDTHTVLITSFRGQTGAPAGTGRYDIKDPFKDPNTGKSIPWLDDPDYGNRIFGFDTGVFKAGGVHIPYEVPNDTFIDPILLNDTDVNPEMFGSQVFMDNTVRVVTPVPEPSSAMLLGMSLLSLIGYRWRRRKIAV